MNQFKAEYLLKGLQKIGYTGINLSWRDLVHGPEFLEEMIEREKCPLISANVYIKESGERFCDPYKIEKVNVVEANGTRRTIRAGIFGLAQPSSLDVSYPGGTAAFEIMEPASAAKAVVAELKTQSDIIIALVYMDGAATRQLISDVGDIDIVIMGNPGYQYQKPSLEDGVLYLSGGRLGKFGECAAVKLSVEKGVVSFRNEEVNLDSSIPDDPELSKVVTAYKDRLQQWRNERFGQIKSTTEKK